VKRANRDRVVLAAIGVLCIVVGGLGLLQSFGALDGSESEPVLLEDVRAFVHRNDGTFWPIVAGIALVVAYLGGRWLLSELRSVRRPPPVRVADGADSLSIDMSALTEAAGSDLEQEPRITAADVSVTNGVTTPRAEIRIAAADDMPLRELQDALGTGPLSRLAHALEHDQLDARVLVTFEPGRRHLV